MMSSVLDLAVFPGNQGGPLMHIIAAKAVAFKEALEDDFFDYALQLQKNAKAMAAAFLKREYTIVSGGTDNHLILIDLRNKNISGKEAENALVRAEITVNKNMVPFDDKSPFITSGIRVGTPAITTRGFSEAQVKLLGGWIVKVLKNPKDDGVKSKVKKEVVDLCREFPVYPTHQTN